MGSNKEYDRGKNPSSHNNRKGTGKDKISFKVSCSPRQKELIEQEFKESGFPTLSVWIMHKVGWAIALKKYELPETLEPKRSKAEFKVYCTREELGAIAAYGKSIEGFKRSLWIVYLLVRC